MRLDARAVERFSGRVKRLLFALLLASLAHAEERLHPTIAGGREWSAQWEEARVVKPYARDPADAVLHHEDGELRIGSGVASVKAGRTRLKVLGGWRNVEMTIYARRGKLARKLDYQAFYLSARSGERHNDDVPCEGTSYHATARFDGTNGFKKELWHTGGYTALRPDPAPKFWPTVPEGKWIGMKFICRNSNRDTHVKLELYLDPDESGQWKLVSEFTDAGGWRGEKPGCDRTQDAILTEAYPAVYFRTDFVDVELKKFSVREIAPLP